MDPEFWNERWRNQRIGFHRPDVNPWLMKYWDRLSMPAGSEVFVPLSGKSLDMRWLAEKGHPVKAIECSPVAVEDFFGEQNWSPERTSLPLIESWQSHDVELFCGDFFDLNKDALANVKAIYDRASLVAFPPEQRFAYVEKLMSLVEEKTPMLLVTLEYPEQEMKGPPFSILETEVRQLFTGFYNIEKIDGGSLLDIEPRWRQVGLSSMDEKVFLLT